MVRAKELAGHRVAGDAQEAVPDADPAAHLRAAADVLADAADAAEAAPETVAVVRGPVAEDAVADVIPHAPGTARVVVRRHVPETAPEDVIRLVAVPAREGAIKRAILDVLTHVQLLAELRAGSDAILAEQCSKKGGEKDGNHF